MGRYSGTSFGSTSTNQYSRGTESGPNPIKKGSDSIKGSQSEDKVVTPMNYRKAKGLCYKCGMKWHQGTNAQILYPCML